MEINLAHAGKQKH